MSLFWIQRFPKNNFMKNILHVDAIPKTKRNPKNQKIWKTPRWAQADRGNGKAKEFGMLGNHYPTHHPKMPKMPKKFSFGVFYLSYEINKSEELEILVCQVVPSCLA